MKNAVYEVLRCEIQVVESIVDSLVDFVVDILGKNQEWQEAGHAFGPLLEQMDLLTSGLSSSLHVLQTVEERFQQLVLFVAVALNRNVVRGSDLAKAYNRGSIVSKQEQAIARANAARQCFARLDQARHWLPALTDKMYFIVKVI